MSLGAGILLAALEAEDTAEKSRQLLENLADMTLEEILEARIYVKLRVATHPERDGYV